MRILAVSNYYPPYEVGGYEQLCRDVMARLAARGHTIHVLTSNRRGTDGHSSGEEQIYRSLHLHVDFENGGSPILQFFFRRPQAERHNRRLLHRMITEICPDVIFFWNIEGLPRSIAREAETLAGIGVAHWIASRSPAGHDEYWEYWTAPSVAPIARLGKRLLGNLARATLRRQRDSLELQMRHVAAVSHYRRQKGITDGTLPVHTKVIYNGVEIEQFYRAVSADSTEPLRLLVAGRLSHEKGAHVAVEALGKLVREQGVGQVHLDLAGTGPASYRAALQEIARRYDIEAKISFLGWLPRAEMPGVVARCHVLILPSLIDEAFSRVVLEAMTGGLAVVGTLTGGTEEILQHEVTGLTFTPGDSDDLADQLKRLIIEPGLRQRLAVHGQQQILAKFSLERMVENVVGLLLEACADAEAHHP